MSLTREIISKGTRDGRWSPSSGESILDLLARAEKAEGGEKAAQDDRRAWEAEATEAKQRAEKAEAALHPKSFADTRDERERAVDYWRERVAEAVRERDEARRVFNESMDKRRELAIRATGLEKDLAAAQAQIADWKERAENCAKDVLRHRLAVQESQARERELRRLLDKLAAYPDPPDGCYCETCSASRAAKLVLSAPQDTTALREFGLRVAQGLTPALRARGYELDAHAAQCIVDAVLQGAE